LIILFVARQPVRCLGSAFDGQTDKPKRTEFVWRRQPVRCPLNQNSARRPNRLCQNNRIRLSVVNPSAVRSPLARNGARRPDRLCQNEQNSSVRRQPVRCPSSRNCVRRPDRSVKQNRICLSVVSELRSTARQILSQKEQNSSVGPSATHPVTVVSELRSTARQILSQKEQNSSVLRQPIQ
jgi:hypothetical protein